MELCHALFDPCVVDPQELVGTLRFLSRNWYTTSFWRGQPQVGRHDLEQYFPQMGRATLCRRIAFGVHLTGLVYFRINTGKAYKRASAGIVANIVNLSLAVRQ